MTKMRVVPSANKLEISVAEPRCQVAEIKLLPEAGSGFVITALAPDPVPYYFIKDLTKFSRIKVMDCINLSRKVLYSGQRRR
jgi:hypothetical protein